MKVRPIPAETASAIVVTNHYLHRKPPISFAFGLFCADCLCGVVTFGVPPSRHLQQSACPTSPNSVLELNRLWLMDSLPRNSESWFLAKALALLPPRIIVSYADPLHGHLGYIYRASNFYYAGWTDMDRKTSRMDYVPLDETKHSREAFRSGHSKTVRRLAKLKYWTVTGNRREARHLEEICGWPKMCWKSDPPPIERKMIA